MLNAIAALSWELFARFRWVSILAAVSLVLVCLLGLLLPESARSPEVAAALLFACAGSLFFLVGMAMHGADTPLEESRSGFPPRLFTLPVPAVVLVGPPLLLATLLIVVPWTLWTLVVFPRYGVDLPLWGPLWGAAVAAWLQALAWTPFPVRWLRLAIITVFLLAVYCGPLLLNYLQVSEGVMAALALVFLAAGYGMALVGVTWGRRGTWVSERSQVGAVINPVLAHVPQPLSSPLRAQLWMEWRMSGWGFYFFGFIGLILTLPNMTLEAMALEHGALPTIGWLPALRETVGDSWLVMCNLAIIPLILSLPGCGETGRPNRALGLAALPLFILTRPISTPAVVVAKALSCVRGALCTWTIVLLGVLGWAIFMNRLGEMSERLVALTGSAPAAVGALVGGVLLIVAITWLWMVQGLWIGLLGRITPTVVAVACGLAFWVGVVLLAVHWRETWWPILGWTVAAALLAKGLAVAWVASRLLRHRFMLFWMLAAVIAAWVIFAAIVVSVVLKLTSGGPLVAGVVVLMLPLARCLAAPLALAHSRSR